MSNEIQSAVGFAHAKPEKAEELATLLVSFAERSRNEEGCLGSWINQDADDPTLFVFYEIWATRKDLARHIAQPYMKEFLAGRNAYLAKELEVRPLHLTGPAPQQSADPAEMNQRYLDAYAARDVDAIMAVYAPGAAAVWEPGKAVSGAQHREAVTEFLKREPKLSAKVSESYVAGDTAALVVDWSIEVPGAPEMTGTGRGLDVLKKNAHGEWRYVITNPFGSQ
ncbi:antibiotic biosynthesis monooxygenase [Streptomyces sp. SAI-127]|uniref:antibiotic biosynthesis monooxygenase n=1 Tax=Streptomyces sp. SAI-127 TaxID=2940543 RepID=UPI002476B402|nr:antibiotic biosynthesis monooxygenase [Streptomyces sp. SAI-127]MDH6489338.1 quinol monooxygenase YgiN/ketosteroid isomerase-like protein [Streptomyces sp. SAI-127]